MWKSLSGFVGVAICSTIAIAGMQSHSTGQGYENAAASELASAIEVAEWSLTRSSMSSVIDKNVQDKAVSLLVQSRQALGNGEGQRARELLNRAMQPLAQMGEGAMDGRHPDPLMHKQNLKETLLSLLPEAERIAREKRASDAFVAEARAEVARSDELMASGEFALALETLNAAYKTVQSRLAGLRSGDDFYLAIPQLPQMEQWSDGLRRIEERRLISQYLLVEAESSGLDVAQLQDGIQRAEAIVADAEQLATQSRWAPALQKLELAYVEYEDSWRTAGVEW